MVPKLAHNNRSTSSLLLAAAFVLAACGAEGDGADDSFSNPTAPPTGADPTTMGESTGEITTTAPPSTSDAPVTGGDDGTGGQEQDVDAFRFTELSIRDPHFFGQTLLGCIDITDTTPLGPDASVNGLFRVAIGGDDPMMADGLLDLSLVLVFRPLDQADGVAANAEFANGSCTAPIESTACELTAGTQMHPTPYSSMGAGVICHSADPNHLGGYSPAPGMTQGPCFHAGPMSATIVTTAFDLDLDQLEISATYDGDPADGFISGTMRGYMPRATAETTILPPSISSVVGKQNVAGLLTGHPDCCETTRNDMDDDGWWVYADFKAERVPWMGG